MRTTLFAVVTVLMFGGSAPRPAVGAAQTPTPVRRAVPISNACAVSPCGGNCVLCPPCTPGIPCPEIACVLGQCRMSATGDCECVAVVPTPLATPTPQCDAVPCGGECTISFPCVDGEPCPAAPVRLGQCEVTSSGSCACVPIGPTPMPTPTPQCVGASCGGACSIAFPAVPCVRPGACNGPEIAVLAGQCEMTASGECDCVPASPTPTATPTPQCSDTSCAGPCTIAFPCMPGEACPGLVQPGECQSSATDECECVPVGSTPAATPTPQCSGNACEGPCVVSFPPSACPPGTVCNGPNVPAWPGRCELNAAGECECVPATPASSPPVATPTPQCDAVPCGGQCVISPPCASRGCEVPDLLGRCEMVSGSCACVPAGAQAADRSPRRRRSLRPRIPNHRVD
jgi:hypothetical protein